MWLQSPCLENTPSECVHQLRQVTAITSKCHVVLSVPNLVTVLKYGMVIVGSFGSRLVDTAWICCGATVCFPVRL